MNVEQQIRARLAEEETLLLATDTDLLPNGDFGTQWLAVTSNRVLVFGVNGEVGDPDTELPLDDITTVRSVHRVGQMAVEALVGARRVELVRCTNSLSERFAKVTRALADARRNKKTPEFVGLDEEEPRHCAECGRLLPERGSFCPACLKKHKVMARFWKYFKPHWGKSLFVCATVLLGVGATLVPPILIRVLVDNVLFGEGGLALLGVLVAGLVSIGMLNTTVEIIRGRLSVWLGSRVMHDVRFDLYQAIQGLTLRRYDKTQVGALMSRLTGDTVMLNDAFTFVGFMALPSFLQLIGICVILIIMNWKLGLLVLIPAPLTVALTVWFYRAIHGYYFQWWQRRSKMTVQANDCISGMRVVKAFSQERQEIEKFREKSFAFSESWYNCDGLWATAMPVISFVMTLGTFLVWLFGGMSILNGSDLTVGTLLAFLAYLGMFYGPLQMLTRLSDFLNRAFTAAQRLFEIMDTDQEVYEAAAAVPLDVPKGDFTFENVHFGYVPDKPVLKGVSAEIHGGEMIGLVGRSGVGKTTVINLVCRFYDVEEGAIRLDGVDLRKYRLRDLRQHIGIVPQEPYLFNGTIYQNIGYAKPDATRQEIIRAAIAANAHGFIMRQVDGYDTRVGERGAQLSGGERQRISIARALLHDPKILILDEATSSVDTETEELVQQALSTLVKGRTTFAIAHRLSTLRNADRLLVMDEGKVAEFGTHEELLAKKGVYHGLVEMQSRLTSVTAVGG